MATQLSPILDQAASVSYSGFKRTATRETSVIFSKRPKQSDQLPRVHLIESEKPSTRSENPFWARGLSIQSSSSTGSTSRASKFSFSAATSRLSVSRDNTLQGSWSAAIPQLQRLSIQGFLRSNLSHRSRFWISEAKFLASEVKLPWMEPLINHVDEEISFEWWSSSKKLTIYMSDSSIEFIRVWGPNIKNEMDDGEIRNPFHFVVLWQWLIS